jgi:hypothetical protein
MLLRMVQHWALKGYTFLYRKVISQGKEIVESQPTFRRYMSPSSLGLTSISSVIYQMCNLITTGDCEDSCQIICVPDS